VSEDGQVLAAVERLEARCHAESVIEGPRFMADLRTVLGAAREALRQWAIVEAAERLVTATESGEYVVAFDALKDAVDLRERLLAALAGGEDAE
jgi:hypothetical protein